jgi:hypothetical protein
MFGRIIQSRFGGICPHSPTPQAILRSKPRIGFNGWFIKFYYRFFIFYFFQMISVIQVLRYHLLELEKVGALCPLIQNFGKKNH